MGLFSGLLGNASQKDADAVERDLANILIDGEQVKMAFSLVRDLIVFTEYRLVLVDKQGLTGKKVSYAFDSVSFRVALFGGNLGSFRFGCRAEDLGFFWRSTDRNLAI